MHHKKAIEFKRSVKALATQMGWEVETVSGKGPTERMVISFRDGGKRHRLATIITRKDKKEISPGEARYLLRKLRARKLEIDEDAENETGGGEGTDESVDPENSMLDNINELIEWVMSWFA